MVRRKEFSEEEKNHVVQFLLESSINSKMAKGKREEAVIFFNSSKRTISRIWAAAMKQKQQGEVIALKNGKKNKRAKRVHIDLELIKSLDLHRRTTQRSLAFGVKCSQSTVGKWVKGGLIRTHTSPLRPDLTDANKMLRVQFSLEALELDTLMNTLKFKSMHNTVHIDEKWFYMTKGMQRYYLTPDEIDPHRSCKSKKFITKVMFMCAVCRPIFGADGTVLFDGKIGIFPFTYEEPAKRSSKNRPSGTMETKAIESITRDVIRDCIINKVWVDEGEFCDLCHSMCLGVSLASQYDCYDL